MIKYILFDVSGTLLHKPEVLQNIKKVLNKNNIEVSEADLKNKHKTLTETIFFPDRTDKAFYESFNAQLIYSIGGIPTKELLNEVFDVCTYRPWEKFSDTKVLESLNFPIGILSNFNSTLKDKLDDFFGDIFKDILVSEVLKVAKPKIEFYEKAVEVIGLLPEEILYIGDSIKLDIEPAKKVGFNTLLIDRDNYYSNSKEISIINDLSQIVQFVK